MSGNRVISFYYDRAGDIMDIVLGGRTAAYSDETKIPGVLVRYSFETDDVVGAIIIGYKIQDIQMVRQALPFAVELPPVDAPHVTHLDDMTEPWKTVSS